MNSSELLEAFRLDVEDLSDPPLWSDLEIYRYLNDACFQFVRMTGGIADFTSEACEVEITAGEATSPLHPSVLRVMSANRRSDNREIEVVNITDLHAHYRSDYGVRVKQFLDDTPGPVRMMVLGMQRGVERLTDSARLVGRIFERVQPGVELRIIGRGVGQQVEGLERDFVRVAVAVEP